MRPLSTATPHVIVMIGIPGAGKSTFAEHFAKTFQAPIVNVGALQQEAGISQAAAQTLGLLYLDELLKTQATIIYEGAAATKSERTALKQRITRAGYQPLFVWVQTESAEAQRRATKPQRNGIALTAGEFEAALKRFYPPAGNEGVTVISGKHTYTSQLKIVLKRLAGPRPEHPDEPRVRPRNIILR